MSGIVVVVDEILETRDVSKSRKRWQRARNIIQVLSLLLFLYLLLGTIQAGSTFLPQNLFFRLDPLTGISSMLAGRSWIAPLALGAVTLLLTLVMGRSWCGWLCPLGTLLDWTPSRRPRNNSLDIPSYWRQVKYIILFTVLLAALLGSLTLIVTDPITLLFRTTTSVALPALNALVMLVEKGLYNITLLQPAVEWFDGLTRGWLVTEQSFHWQNLFLLLPFAGILALNAVRPRFWCRYLCPLGALLALFSKIPGLRYKINESKCISCRKCAISCPMGAIDSDSMFSAKSDECTVCLNCVNTCPVGAISFNWQWGLPSLNSYDLSRRRLFISVGAVTGATALLGIANIFPKKDTLLLRPPGSDNESFLGKCIRCGECMKVCPTSGLQPSLTTAGATGLWTPVLVPRLGYCDYSCNSCGQVCPTGAIPLLSLEVKRNRIIGTAEIDRERCIPWAEGLDCIVCEEMCPVPEKAIELKEEPVINKFGEETTVLRPRVTADLCIGCGICEYQCPLEGEAAIRVRSIDIIE